MKKATLLIVAVVVLLLAFVIGTLLHNTKKEESAIRLPEVNRTALVRMHSPSLGKIDAPVVIVEFFDPACETCRAFYPLVKEIMAANPDKIRLVLRYTPFHKGSDQVVAVLEAARKQGKFWPALEALLGARPRGQSTIPPMSISCGNILKVWGWILKKCAPTCARRRLPS